MKESDRLRNEVESVVSDLEALARPGQGLPPAKRPTVLRGARLLVQLLAKIKEHEKQERRDTG